jgi:predicted lipid-binding transport protein (Tim44 family)
MTNTPDTEGRRTYPLGLLFLILTSAAILAAVAAPLVRAIDWNNIGDPKVLAAIFGCIMGGCLLGMIMGLYCFHRSTGVLIGLAVGAAVGPLAGLLVSLGTESLMSLAPALLIGSIILILVAWAIRPGEKKVDDEIIMATEVKEPRSPGSGL